MSFEVFLVLIWFFLIIAAGIIFKIKEIIDKKKNANKQRENKIRMLEEKCEQQERELLFYRNEAQTR